MDSLFDQLDESGVAGMCSAASGAYFSPDSTYRYALWRRWNMDKACVMFIGLNPSIADEVIDDVTIKKCMGFARRWNYGGIYMLNLFAFVSTQPTALLSASDPVGHGNDEAFSYYKDHASLFVAAWGSIETRYRPRLQWQSRITKALSLIGQEVHCLGFTADRSPRHPSRIAYSTPAELFWTP